MGVTDVLLNYLASARYQDLPAEVVGAGKRAIMDTIAVILAGSSRPGCGELAGLVQDWGGKPESSVCVFGVKVPAHEAALTNGTMARALDFDDCHIHTAVHPSATIIPTALAAAEMKGSVSGQELIKAIVLGTELAIRLRTVPDSCNLTSGWSGEVHSTFGAATTAGSILNLSKDSLGHALGLAYSQAAGNLQPVVDGALASRFQQGFAARSGLLSAVLASKGVTGSRDFLDGKFGFYPVYYRGIGYDLGRLLNQIGQQYQILNVAAKPYPCCAYAHGPVQNLLEIMKHNGLKEDNISEVILRLNERMYGLCTPPDIKWRPRNVVDAMFSLPYAVGTAMLRGDVFLPDFSDDAIQEKPRLRVIDKVKAIVDDEIDKESRQLNLPLSLNQVDVRTKSGKLLSKKIYHVKGYPENPMSLNDVARKLKRCAQYAAVPIPETTLDRVIDIVQNMETVNDAGLLGQMLSSTHRKASRTRKADI